MKHGPRDAYEELPHRSWLAWVLTAAFIGIVYGSAFLVGLLFADSRK